MLDFKPEKLEVMKERFPQAVSEVVDVDDVIKGVPAASSRRSNVFDFADGMRLVVSVDKANETTVLHVSASGTKEYGQTIGDLDDFVEDVVLRFFALMGKEQPGEVHAIMMDNGVLHLMYEDYVL